MTVQCYEVEVSIDTFEVAVQVDMLAFTVEVDMPSVEIGVPGMTGPAGPPGAQGDPGTDGTDGVIGADGGQLIPFQANGTLTVRSYPTAVWIPKTSNYRVRATCNSRGTGADLIVNLGINTVLALSGTDRPTIPAGSGAGTDASTNALALTQGQIVTSIDVEQVGTGFTTLVVQIIEEP